MTADTRKVLDAIVEGWNKKDWLILEAVHSPEWIDRSSPEGFNDLAYMREFFDQFTASFPDMEMKILHSLIHENEIAYYYSINGTHQKSFRNFPPSGRRVEFTAMMMLRLEQGKVAEAWGVTDVMTFFDQLRSAARRD